MREKIFTLFVLFTILNVFGQKVNATANIFVVYQAQLKESKDYESRSYPKVALLIGKDFSFSCDDGLLGNFYEGYIPENTNLNSSVIYNIDKIIYFKNSTYTELLYPVMDFKLGYLEKYDMKWKIAPKYKIINGSNCQMATTEKYGRIWTAYFSPDYSFPYGPYKFSGLPGLIMEIFDEKDDYHFTVISIQNKKVGINFDADNYKILTKKKFLETEYNLKYTLNSYPPMEEGEFKKEMEEMIETIKKKGNNPIELKPFD